MCEHVTPVSVCIPVILPRPIKQAKVACQLSAESLGLSQNPRRVLKGSPSCVASLLHFPNSYSHVPTHALKYGSRHLDALILTLYLVQSGVFFNDGISCCLFIPPDFSAQQLLEGRQVDCLVSHIYVDRISDWLILLEDLNIIIPKFIPDTLKYQAEWQVVISAKKRKWKQSAICAAHFWRLQRNFLQSLDPP